MYRSSRFYQPFSLLSLAFFYYYLFPQCFVFDLFPIFLSYQSVPPVCPSPLRRRLSPFPPTISRSLEMRSNLTSRDNARPSPHGRTFNGQVSDPAWEWAPATRENGEVRFVNTCTYLALTRRRAAGKEEEARGGERAVVVYRL